MRLISETQDELSSYIQYAALSGSQYDVGADDKPVKSGDGQQVPKRVKVRSEIAFIGEYAESIEGGPLSEAEGHDYPMTFRYTKRPRTAVDLKVPIIFTPKDGYLFINLQVDAKDGRDPEVHALLIKSMAALLPTFIPPDIIFDDGFGEQRLKSPLLLYRDMVLRFQRVILAKVALKTRIRATPTATQLTALQVYQEQWDERERFLERVSSQQSPITHPRE